MTLFQDPDLRDRGWITSYEHALRGTIETAGHLIDFSDAPGSIERPSPLAGQHTRQILEEIGYEASEIVRLNDAGVIRALDLADPTRSGGAARTNRSGW